MTSARLLSFPVTIKPEFFLLTGFLSFSRGASLGLAIWMACVTFSILWHELGHALVMRRYGGRPQIVLHGMGGLAHFGHNEISLSIRQEIAISLAGPLAGLGLGVVTFLTVQVMGAPTGHLETFVGDMLWINIGWSLFNLLPILPMDGGMVFESLLKIWDIKKGPLVARIVATALCVAFALLALSMQWYFGVLLAGYFGIDNINGLKQARQWESDQELEGDANAADQAYRDEKYELAAERYRDLLERSKTGAWRAHLASGLTRSLLALDKPEEAEKASWLAPPDYPISEFLRARVFMNTGRSDRAIEILESRLSVGTRTLGDLNLLLEALLQQGDVERAEGAFERHKDELEYDEWTYSNFDIELFELGHFEASAKYALLGHERFGEFPFAYNAACSLARLGNKDEALRWLRTALEIGSEEPLFFATDEDLNSLHGTPEFEELKSDARALLEQAPE